MCSEYMYIGLKKMFIKQAAILCGLSLLFSRMRGIRMKFLLLLPLKAK